MLNASRTLLIVLALLPPPARAADKAAEVLSKEYVTVVRAETGYLVRAVERLQEAIVEELSGRKERTLYRRADEVLTLALEFEAALRGAPTRAQLYAWFTEFDGKMHELLEAVDGLGKEARGLRREAARVREADEELHFALSAGDTSAERVRQVMKRQARRLLSSARELERTAQYALLKMPGDVSPGDFRKLVEAAALFEKSAEAGAAPEQLRKAFAELDRAWAKAVGVLKQVKPRENRYLLRSAAEVDRLHERLHRLLGLKGERARLILST
jgi:hypothetical protein